MGKEIDPSDIGKYPDIIKKAQTEITNMDVLVCGQCNNVFHFVEKFREHKSSQCTKSSAIKDNLETRPVVWSFLLWKASQLNQDQKDNNNWRLYQTWMKLDEAIKETWVVAGRTIQSFAKIGQGNLQEMPVKITKTVVDNSESGRGRQLVTNRVVNKTPMSQKELDASFNELKNSDTSTPIGAKRPLARPSPTKAVVNRVGSTTIAAKPGVHPREALRTMGTNEDGTLKTKEYRIDRIYAKRFNPSKKAHDYLIKWENMVPNLNTWEPVEHLSSCLSLLDTFEKQLARQKEQRQAAQRQAAQKAPDVAKKNDSMSSQSEDDGATSIKRRKIDASPVKQVVAVETGIVNNLNHSPLSKIKPNGLQASLSNEKSADVVITSAKDGKQTGIVKKSGVSIAPVPKNEAQIKFIPKGGDLVSGVVRVSAHQNQAVAASGGRVVQKVGNTTVKPVTAAKPQIKQQQHQHQQPKTTTMVQQSRTQSVHQLTAINAPGQKAGGRPTITRVSKGTPNAGSVQTPEQKIAALTRQGNIKITRKTVNAPVAAQIGIQSEEEFNINDAAFAIEPKVEAQEPQHATLDAGDWRLSGSMVSEPKTKAPISKAKNASLENAQQQQQQQQQQQHILTTQLLGQVGAGGQVALIDASQLEQGVGDVKKESEETEITLNEEQLQQLQAGGILTDQDGLQQILAANEDGSQQLIQFVTGEDGTIYQVAGKNEQGQTILIAQGADGEQQCVYVAEDGDGLGMEDGSNGVLAVDGSLVVNHLEQSAEVQQQLQQQLVADGQQGIQYAISADDSGNVHQPLTVATEDGDSQDGQITAEVVQADLPSPGGTRRVVLQLPDGSFVVTEVDGEQFKALNMQG